MLFVLVGVAVIVVVLVLAVIVIVLVLAFVLVGVAVIVVVLVLAVIVVAFVLAKDADLLLIPTAARLSGAIHPGGRACSASSSRGASARSILAGPEGVPMSQVGCLRGEVNHNCLRAVVADGDIPRGSSCGGRGGSRCARACGGARRTRCRVSAIFNPEGPIDLGRYDLYVVSSGIADYILNAALVAFYFYTIWIKCLTTFVSDEEGKEHPHGWWRYVLGLVRDAPLRANDCEERCVSSRLAAAGEGIYHPTTTTLRNRRCCRTCGGARRTRCGARRSRCARARGCLPPCRKRKHQQKGEGC